MICPCCSKVAYLQWQAVTGVAWRHLRASCPTTGKYIKFVEQTPENSAQADLNPRLGEDAWPPQGNLFGDNP